MTLATWFRLAQTKSRRRKARQQFRLFCEPLEARTVPALFWVTNTNDEGVGSLRQAITDANTAPGADNIKFKSSADGTITLTTGELSITSDLQIDGRGTTKSVINGGGKSRVFNIAASTTVGIKDVTITNGFVNGTNGGGIRNAGTVTLNDTIVANNIAQSGNGGGIWNTGDLVANKSQISNNKAATGGGLVNDGGGTVFLNKTTVSGNFGFGAALRSQSGSTLTVRNSLVTGNTGQISGGGIASGGTLNVINSTVSNNSSPFGAIYLLGEFNGGGPSGNVVISGSRIVNNGPAGSSSGCGGILSSSSSHVLIEDSEISGNVGTFAGGIGALVGTFEVIRCNISGNVTNYGAAGIFANYQLSVVDSTISGNVGGPGSTGGINSFIYDTTIVRSTVSNNIGGRVGGIANYGFIAITDSTISGNTAIPNGPASLATGGVYIFAYVGSIDNSTISGNTVIADGMQPPQFGSFLGAAGGVFVGYSGTTIDHSTIVGNRVVNAPSKVEQVVGGVLGLNVFGEANVGIRNTIVALNSATDRDPDVTGSFQSAGHNLIGILTSGATGFVASDLTGGLSTPLDPRIGPLKNNGGPTFTHALKGNSPALNAGDNADAPPTDQRGQTRIVGGTIDIGAFEAQDDDNGKCGSSGGRSAPPAGSAPTKSAWLWTAAFDNSNFNSMLVSGTVHSRLSEFDRDDIVFLGLFG